MVPSMTATTRPGKSFGQGRCRSMCWDRPPASRCAPPQPPSRARRQRTRGSQPHRSTPARRVAHCSIPRTGAVLAPGVMEPGPRAGPLPRAHRASGLRALFPGHRADPQRGRRAGLRRVVRGHGELGTLHGHELDAATDRHSRTRRAGGVAPTPTATASAAGDARSQRTVRHPLGHGPMTSRDLLGLKRDRCLKRDALVACGQGAAYVGAHERL
jgi:hypothetical protein